MSSACFLTGGSVVSGVDLGRVGQLVSGFQSDETRHHQSGDPIQLLLGGGGRAGDYFIVSVRE